MDFIRSVFFCRPVVERDVLDIVSDNEELIRVDSHINQSVSDSVDTSSDKRYWTSKYLKALDQDIEELMAESYALQKARRGYGSVFYRETTRSQKPPTSNITSTATVPSADTEIRNIKSREIDSEIQGSPIGREIPINSKSLEQQRLSKEKEDRFGNTLVHPNTFSSFTFISEINQIRIRDYLSNEAKNVQPESGFNMKDDESDSVMVKNPINTYDIEGGSSDYIASIQSVRNHPKLVRNYPGEVQMEDESYLICSLGILNCRRELESHSLYRIIANWTSVVFGMN